MIAAAAAGVIVPLCSGRFASAAALRQPSLTVAQRLDSDVATRSLSLLPSPLLQFYLYLKLWWFTHYLTYHEHVYDSKTSPNT